jgi:F-type H+-transporting ATPase subunit a
MSDDLPQILQALNYLGLYYLFPAFCNDIYIKIFVDFTFFNIMIPFLIVIIFFPLIIIFLQKYFKLIPNSIMQNIFESKLEFIFNIIKQQFVNANIGYSFCVIFFSVFYFILFTNILGILPFGIALTSHLILILYLSLLICLSILIWGLYFNDVKFFKIFMPRCPLIMLPLLILIEIFSYIIRMFSLAIRLGANIMAGHTLIFIISNFTFLLYKINFWVIFLGVLIIFIVMLLELCVAFLQAYVFLILTLIYFNDSFNCNH